MTSSQPTRTILSLRPTRARSSGDVGPVVTASKTAMATPVRTHAIPQVSDALMTSIPLKAIEHFVLLLIELDPQLATREHRPRLYVTLGLFPPRRSHQRVGHAVARLRDLAAAGVVRTRAFIDVEDGARPSRDACERLFAILLNASAAREETSVMTSQRRVKFLRMFGHL